MPQKNNISQALEKRLEILERSMKKKDDEICELKSSLRSIEQKFDIELKERDAVITDLFSKIEELDSKNQPVSDEIGNDIELAETTLEPVEVEAPVKVEHDLLVLGDSLIRHVKPELINPGGDTTIECLPGARPEGLIEKFQEICQTNSYKRIILHAGTNLVPKFSPVTVADKIVDALEKIRTLSPQSKVTFSALLPKEGDHLTAGINEVNYRVEQAGLCGHFRTRYGFIRHSKFFANRLGQVNHRLFQRDRIHLTDLGSRALEKSLTA